MQQISHRKKHQSRILLLLDKTGSMQQYIEETCSQLIYLINFLNSKFPAIDFQFGVIGYADYDQSQNQNIDVFQFSNVNTAIENLHSIKIGGGFDLCEDINGGLQAALKLFSLQDESSINVLVHVCDAPCHGSEYHEWNAHQKYSIQKSDYDKFNQWAPKDISFKDIFSEMQKNRIHYQVLVTGQYPDTCDKMLENFNMIWQQEQKKKSGQVIAQFEFQRIKNISKEQFWSFITKGIQKSVTTSLEAASASFNSKKIKQSQDKTESGQLYIDKSQRVQGIDSADQRKSTTSLTDSFNSKKPKQSQDKTESGQLYIDKSQRVQGIDSADQRKSTTSLTVSFNSKKPKQSQDKTESVKNQ